MRRKLAILFFLLTGFLHAEQNSGLDLSSFLSQNGPLSFSSGGTASLPAGILSGMSNGKVSPIIQFYITNDIINKCAKDVLAKGTPAMLDPYVAADFKWKAAQCKLEKCYQQAWLVSILPQLSSNEAYGGSSDPGQRDSSKNLGLVLGQVFQKKGDCVDGDDGIDPQLLAFFFSQSK